ncbi:MAG: beta-glucosidase BglX [Saprospiraceae bacterium]|nr:beta-glucosidase BglX [Saprospiraceae bacterium]
MKIQSTLLLAALLFIVAACTPKVSSTVNLPKPAATDAPTEAKIEALLRKMTLEEKIGQLNQYSSFWEVTGPAPQGGNQQKRYEQLRNGLVGSMLNVTGAEATREVQRIVMENSRLKIPLLIGYDVIHGYKTMFPIPLGEAASWDLNLMEQTARIAATEAAAAGIHWTFGPMMDISRDARWGRIMEGAGEDPYLGSLVAAARVKGFQGSDLSRNNTLAACAKHYAAYGFAEAGRDYNTVDISEYTLHNVVLPPFKAAVDAGVATFMNAFNEIGGIPATGSSYLQRDLLKGQWGFDGFMVSDWGSIGEMVYHGFAADNAEAARIAMNAGSDMDMESRAYIEHLAQAVKDKSVPEAYIDDSVRRVLRLKFHLGLFDDPYRYCDEEREKRLLLSPAFLDAARDAGRKSIVLLKNEGDLLPLKKDIRRIAVIGPLAADKDSPLGSWRAQAETGSAVSLLEGIQAAVGANTEVIYAQGVALAIGNRNFLQEITINQTDKSGFSEAIAAARRADVVVLAIGEDCWQTGEGRSQSDIGLSGLQEELFNEISRINKKVAVVLMNGRPLAIENLAASASAILETWHLGSQAGNAIADVLFGDYNPSGKLPVSFPRNTGQAPIYYNHKSTGRGTYPGNNTVFWSHYTDVPNTPLYPFGYGLSYTTFSYSDLELSAKEITASDKLTVRLTLTNTGKVAGTEVVQLYIQDVVGSATRPVKELKGFEHVTLAPGESKQVSFTLSAKDLAFYTAARKWEAEPGAFRVYVGTNSQEVKEAGFTLK